MGRRLFIQCATILLLCCGWMLVPAAPAHARKGTAVPQYSIGLKALGYREPPFERVITGRYPASINYFTSDRLLVTFNTRGLLARNVQHCGGLYDDDQLVDAVLLSLPEGKILSEAKWQLHDHSQYIWPVHDGILLRRCNGFELLQNSLSGNRILNYEERPVLVQTSPDGRAIVVETEHEKHTPEEHKRLIEKALLGNGMIPQEDIDINIVALDKSAAHGIGTVQMHAPVYVPVVREGLYNTLPAQHNHWLIVYQPFLGKPEQVAKVESTCAPPLVPLSDDVFVVATCVSTFNYHVLIALNRQGKELWRDEWLNNLSRPVFALSSDNQRFAVGTVHTLSNIDGFGSIDTGSAHTEDITVYSTYKGEPLLSVSVSPPYATGQNFALSPNGSQLAVVNEGKIEVYDVPHGK